jgi:hypothetical protein
MSRLNGSHLLAGALALLYVAFLVWYGGHGQPLTAAETERYLAEIRARADAVGHPHDDKLVEELRRLAASDDGNEYYMLNLIRFREQAQYPPGSPWSGTALDADARYSRAIAPYLFKHGGHPILIGSPEGRFIDDAGVVEWHRIALVRYRSRRDMLEMIVDLADKDIGVHKWASIERTEVFPVRSAFDLFLPRGLVGAVLLALGWGGQRILKMRRRQPH